MANDRTSIEKAMQQAIPNYQSLRKKHETPTEEQDQRNSSTQPTKLPQNSNPTSKRLLPDQENNPLRQRNQNDKRRVEPNPIKRRIKDSVLKKYFPYLVAGGSTGIGIGLGFKELIL